MTPGEFTHYQAAHCETGVTSNLLRHRGLPVSEPMAFGIGSGLFFGYLPWIKIMGLPLTTYRSFPGSIFKKTCSRLGVPFEYQKFRDPLTGKKVLDEHLSSHGAVGLRGNIYWLPYIPEAFRFQFNAHHFVVFGKAGEDYLVSDPVLEGKSECSSHALTKSRFSKGPLAPKGLLFYPRSNDADVARALPEAVRTGIRETVRTMLFSPLPFFGVRGIVYLSRQMSKWPRKLSPERHKLYMANVVRMQEEIGTGGAGFRYLYAAFLQEAGEKLNNSVLLEASKAMTETGNTWREFATLAAKFCKDRLDVPYDTINNTLADIAGQERAVYQDLRRRYL